MSIPWTYELTRPGIRRYARAFSLTDPVFYWLEAAREAGWPDLPAPFGYLGEPIYLPGLSDGVFPDPGGQPDLGFKSSDVLDLGTAHEVLRTPCAGETLTCTTQVLDLKPARTQAGDGVRVEREMLFHDARDGLVFRQRRWTLHYHGA